MLNNKTILITGGTGSFGRAFTSKVLKSFPKVKEIRIFSRDEKNMICEKIILKKIFIGDVRDVQSLNLHL